MAIRMYEQADRTGNRIVYSWVLDFPYRGRKQLRGDWKWIRGKGCRGCFTTNNAKCAVDTAWDLAKAIPNFDVLSNGTHAVHGAPRFIGSAFHNPDAKFDQSDGYTICNV